MFDNSYKRENEASSNLIIIAFTFLYFGSNKRRIYSAAFTYLRAACIIKVSALNRGVFSRVGGCRLIEASV